MGDTKIEWADKTWTPLRAKVKPDAVEIAKAKGYTSLVQILEARKPNGELRSPPGKTGPHCEHVSDGCSNCYSETNGERCFPANGTGLPFDRRARDLVDLFVDEKILVQPLSWRKPKDIFVCSQTDLFGEFYTDDMIDRVFAVMELCPRHRFQVLTKRAARQFSYLSENHGNQARRRVEGVLDEMYERDDAHGLIDRWPLPNVIHGVSVEDQPTANERIPLLLLTPAEKRFISYEPALGPVDFTCIDFGGRSYFDSISGESYVGTEMHEGKKLDWVIYGGESGPGARPNDINWARRTRDQCKAAGTKFFMKQYGADPWDGGDGDHTPNAGNRIFLKSRKGGDMSEWAEDLRVRELL